MYFMQSGHYSFPWRFFMVPDFADPDRAQTARQIFAILRVFILSVVILQAVQAAMAPHYAWHRLGLMLATVAFSLAILGLTRRGLVRLSGFMLVGELWLLITIFSWTASGLGARAAWGYFIVVFIAGMLLGRWAGIGATAICSLSTLAVALFAPIRSSDPVRFWLVNSLFLLIVHLLQNLSSRSIHELLAKTNCELRERLLAQAALFESDRKHREMVNSLPFCVFEADLQGQLTFLNQTALNRFGFSKDEFLPGVNVSDIVADGDKLRAKESVRCIVSGEEVSFHEFLVQGKNGSPFTVLMRMQLLSKNGIPIGLQGSLVDISDRKQAEKEKEQIISLLQATLESTADAILVVDLTGRIVHFNQRFTQLWQIPDEILAVGDDARALAYVSDQLIDSQGFIDRVQALYTDLLTESFDLLEFKDGRYFERYSRPQLLGGQPVGRVWSFRDISERKRSEEALLSRNQFISSLLHAIPVAVFFKDKEGKYSGCNDEFTEIMGVTSEEIKGKTVYELWPSELAETYHQKDLELMRERKHQVYEFQVQDKNGKLRPVIYAKDVFFDANGEVEGLVGAFLDITERKLAEAALRESELRYRTLFEAASDAIFLMKGNLFFDCNSKTLEIFGCAREQIIGASPDQFSPPLQLDGRDSRSKAREKIDAAYDGRQQSFEWVHLRADQTTFIAEVTLTRIELRVGIFLLAMVRDISQRKRLEEQLRQAQKMEAIGILAGGVAHDFNNILSTIVGYGSLLHMKLKKGDPLNGYVERILGASERAANLTGSLLAFSRKQEIELLAIDLNDVIYGFHKILARLIGEDIDFKLSLASRSLVVDADVRQIEQVLMNLANNSRDAMPRGGRLTISTAAVSLDPAPGGLPSGSYAAVAVADSGLGMEKEIQAHIFEPFFTTKEVGKGTGLGLAIVYGIVKNHGGVVTLDSTPGQGTTFTIYLPLKSQSKKKAERRKQDNIPSGSETILLIEDDPAVRQVTRSVLEEFGYSVLEAADGIAALDIFRQERERIGLVLCDLIMPKLNGRETLAAIQKMKKGIKAIFMSGYTAGIIADKGIADAGMHLLLKPLNPGEMLKKIRSVLDKR
jgi:PAS domain S-box-containing protein